MNTAAIPEELKARPQWVTWKAVERDGKPTKVPLNPKGGPGKSNDPATWGTFGQAVAALKQNGVAGIGFVFSPDDPFTGIDLDHAFVGGQPRFCAKALIKWFDTYTEMPMTSDAREIFEIWYFERPDSVLTTRLDTYGHRLMPLLAINEGLDIITGDIAAKTIALLNYQYHARQYANPIDADNCIAKLEERIRRLLASGPLTKRDLERRGNKARHGIWLWDQAIKNLRSAGEITWDPKTKKFTMVN